MPKPIIDQLWALSSKALADEGVRKSLNSLSFSVEPMNPTEFAAYVRSETQRWAKMVKEAAIEPE